MASTSPQLKRRVILVFAILQIIAGPLFYMIANAREAIMHLHVMSTSREVEIRGVVDQEKWQQLLERNSLPPQTTLYDFVVGRMAAGSIIPAAGMVLLWVNAAFLLWLWFRSRDVPVGKKRAILPVEATAG